jgi:DNA replication protein DnaC
LTWPPITELSDGQKRMIKDGMSQNANGRLNIPIRYRQMGLGVLDAEKSLIDQAKAAIYRKRSLFLYGGVGSGKTQLAVSLMLDWYAENFATKPYFLSCVELFQQLKDAITLRQSESSVLGQYEHYPLLILDDVGAEKLSDWQRSILYVLIDRIYRNTSLAIFTSNLSLHDIAEAVDGRLASRIAEMADILKLDGKDRRIANMAIIEPVLKR